MLIPPLTKHAPFASSSWKSAGLLAPPTNNDQQRSSCHSLQQHRQQHRKSMFVPRRSADQPQNLDKSRAKHRSLDHLPVSDDQWNTNDSNATGDTTSVNDNSSPQSPSESFNKSRKLSKLSAGASLTNNSNQTLSESSKTDPTKSSSLNNSPLSSHCEVFRFHSRESEYTSIFPSSNNSVNSFSSVSSMPSLDPSSPNSAPVIISGSESFQSGACTSKSWHEQSNMNSKQDSCKLNDSTSLSNLDASSPYHSVFESCQDTSQSCLDSSEGCLEAVPPCLDSHPSSMHHHRRCCLHRNHGTNVNVYDQKLIPSKRTYFPKTSDEGHQLVTQVHGKSNRSPTITNCNDKSTKVSDRLFTQIHATKCQSKLIGKCVDKYENPEKIPSSSQLTDAHNEYAVKHIRRIRKLPSYYGKTTDACSSLLPLEPKVVVSSQMITAVTKETLL